MPLENLLATQRAATFRKAGPTLDATNRRRAGVDMALRSIETRFPEAVLPEDLGVVSRPEVVGATQFRIIGFQPACISPYVLQGAPATQTFQCECAYALFATPVEKPPSGATPADFDEIRWRVVSRLDNAKLQSGQSGKAGSTQPLDGFFLYDYSRQAPEAPQDFKVVAEVYLNKGLVTTVAIAQGVRAPYYALESLYASRATAGGENNAASRLVAYYLDPFIRDAASAVGCPLDWLAGLVYQRVYANIADRLHYGADHKQTLITGLMNDKLPPKLLWTPLGVCRVPLPLAALALGKLVLEPEVDAGLFAQGLTRPYLAKLEEGFGKLDAATKQDLFNRLRFPKSSVLIGATLASLLKTRRYPGLGWDHADLRRHLLADFANLAAEKPALSPKPATLDEKGFKEAAKPLGAGLGFATRVETLFKGNFIKRFFTPPPAGATPPPAPLRYGGFALRRGDSDARGIYAGTVQPPDTTPRPCGEQFVEALQTDLRNLGFRQVDRDSKGEFGLNTEWALRHFQGYAKLAAYPGVTVAREAERPESIPDRLEEDLGGERLKADVRQTDIDAAKAVGGTTPWHPVRVLRLYPTAPNKAAKTTEPIEPDETLKGPVTGILDEETRALLGRWKQQRYRCPVVLGIWEMGVDGSGAKKPLGVADEAGGNLWHGHDGSSYYQGRKGALAAHAYDLSGNFAFPATRSANGFHPLGKLTWYAPQDTHGLVSVSWSDECAFKPIMFDPDYENTGWSPAQVSTFKVIHSVVSVEASTDGGIDPINAYDGAYISLGLYHWTISPFGNAGELDALLARFRYEFPEDYARHYENWGLGVLRPDKTAVARWDENPERLGHRFWASGTRTYVGYPGKRIGPADNDWLAFPKEELDCFRGWHVVYRFAMAIRTVPNFRQMLWLMAQGRIGSIRTVEWPNFASSADALKRVVNMPDGKRPTLGAIFTAEVNVALLLRWHVNMPANIAAGGTAAATLVAVFARARELYEAKHRQLLAAPESPDAAFTEAAARYVRIADRALWQANARDEKFFTAAPTTWESDPLKTQVILLDGILLYLKERKEKSEKIAVADERTLEALADGPLIELGELLKPESGDAKARLKAAENRLNAGKTLITTLKSRAAQADVPEAGQPWRPEAGQSWAPYNEQPWREVETELRKLDGQLRNKTSVMIERLAQAQGVPPPSAGEKLPSTPPEGTAYGDLAAHVSLLLDRVLARLRQLDGSKMAEEDLRLLVRECNLVGDMAERAPERLEEGGPPPRVKDKGVLLLNMIVPTKGGSFGRQLADQLTKFAETLTELKTKEAAAAAGVARLRGELNKQDLKQESTQKQLAGLEKLKEAQTEIQNALAALKPAADNSAAELAAARAKTLSAREALAAAKPSLDAVAVVGDLEKLARDIDKAVDEENRLQTAGRLCETIRSKTNDLVVRRIVRGRELFEVVKKGEYNSFTAFHNLLNTMYKVSRWKQQQSKLVKAKPLDPTVALSGYLTLSTNDNSFEVAP